jgi:hypothetical protein
VRIPVVKVLWGMFAFPVMYPAGFFRAAFWPMLGVIASTLLWVSGVIGVNSLGHWVFLLISCALFAWLAVRVHRAVLLPPSDEGGTGDVRILPLANRYLAALVAAGALKFVFSVLVLALVSIFLARYTPVTDTAPPAPSAPDPAVQNLIDYTALVIQVPLAYLLARCSTLLPALALGHAWAPRAAWQQTRGNGWRLVVVVFLLPWALGAAVDWAYASLEIRILVGLLAILRAVFLALGVIALSLSYRELPQWPVPPPTPPPS